MLKFVLLRRPALRRPGLETGKAEKPQNRC